MKNKYICPSSKNCELKTEIDCIHSEPHRRNENCYKECNNKGYVIESSSCIEHILDFIKDGDLCI